MSGDPTPSVPSGSAVALTVLVVLVIVSPWPFGSVHLRTTQAIALVSLATALGAFLWDGWFSQLQLPTRAILWPLLGLWALAVFQLVPIPEGLHRWVAPGSAAVWHPGVPAAAAVLGSGPHPISLYPDATRRWLAFATGVISLALAAAPALRDRRLLLRAATAVVAGAVLVAVYGFIARLAFGNKLYGIWSVPTVAPFGPFVSKNHFAGYVELAALLAVGLATGLADEARHGPGWLSWVESRRSKWVVIAWGAAFVLALAVPVSLSRGGVVSLCAGLLGFGTLRLWTRGLSRFSARAFALTIAASLLATTAVVVVLPTDAHARILTLVGVASDRAGSYRLGIWRDTLRLIGSSPLVGSGFGAYVDALPRFKTSAGQLGVEHSENDYLEHLAEGGLVGLALAGVSALAVFLSNLRSIRAEEHRLARALSTAALAGGVALAFHSCFDFNLHIPANALVAAFFVGVAGMSGGTAGATEEVHGPPGTPTLAVIMLAGSLLAGVLSPWTQSGRPPATIARAPYANGELRRSAISSDIVSLLKERPAQAGAWVTLGWLSLSVSPSEARALASWGVTLDPQYEALRRASTPLGESGP